MGSGETKETVFQKYTNCAHFGLPKTSRKVICFAGHLHEFELKIPRCSKILKVLPASAMMPSVAFMQHWDGIRIL
jgi:hypothetical protein